MYNNVLFVLVLCGMLFGRCFSQFRPLSPCPRIFKYENDDYQWYGRITIVSSQYGAALKLNTKFSIKTRLPSQYVGRLELLGDRADVLQQVLYGQAVNYRVHFPLLYPLPKVTEIVFNGKAVCTGPPEYADRGEIVTSISMDHVLYLSDTEQGEYNQNHIPSQSDTNIHTSTFNNMPTGFQEIYTGNEAAVYMLQPDVYNPDNFAQPFPINTRPNKFQNNDFVPHEEQKPNPVPWTTMKPVATVNPDGDRGNFVTNFNPRPPINGPTFNESSSLSECGITAHGAENALIIGGEQTVRGDWPWVVAMFVKKPNGLEFVCSGTLISDRHVISAAHCLHQKNNRPTNHNEVILKLGAFNLQDWTDEDARTLAVESISAHPKFDGNLGLKHDIVIITVKQTVTFTNFIRPVCLWEDDVDLSGVVGKYGTVIGWGRNEFGLIVSAVPNMVQIPIVSTETCKASKQAFHVLTSETTFCAGKKDGTGPCNGDSGGGMYLHHNGRWRIRGVVSASLRDPTSANTCDLSEYIVFTDAAKYSTWMKSVL